MIPQSQISKLSNRILREQGGRRIPEYVLERDYCISWFLVGLSMVPLRNQLAFKGGTALRHCYFADYRFSEDLDFTLLQEIPFDDIKKELEKVYEKVKYTSNVSLEFSRQDLTVHHNSYTFYLAYEGPLPKTSTTKEIKVDITIKERIVHQLSDREVLNCCEEFLDIPKQNIIRVYPLAEIAIEKIVALLDRASTEPRDLYDLWYITEVTKLVDLNDYLVAVEMKLKYRGKKLTEVRDEFRKKEMRLKKTWESRLGAQMSSIPEFDSIYRAVKRRLRQARIIS